VRADAERSPAWLTVIVSALAFASAYVLTTAVHELAHALVAVAYGLDPVWRGDDVPHLAGTAGQETVVALAGPACSLATGALALTLAARTRGYPGLLLNWSGLIGLAGFFGYLISGVFAPSGDIADALSLAQAPSWVGWLGFALGLGGLLGLARVAATRLVALAPRRWSPGHALRILGLLAVPIATMLLIVGGIPIGPPLIAQLIVILLALLLALVFGRAGHPGALAAVPRLVPAAAVFLVLALIEWLVLRPGLPLG